MDKELLRPGLEEALQIVEAAKAYCYQRVALFPEDSSSWSAWDSRRAQSQDIAADLHGRLGRLSSTPIPDADRVETLRVAGQAELPRGERYDEGLHYEVMFVHGAIIAHLETGTPVTADDLRSWKEHLDAPLQVLFDKVNPPSVRAASQVEGGQ